MRFVSPRLSPHCAYDDIASGDSTAPTRGSACTCGSRREGALSLSSCGINVAIGFSRWRFLFLPQKPDGDALGDSRWRPPLRNFTARACPKAQPVMQAIAWVAQRSISTKVIKQTLAVVIARVSDTELL